MKSKRISKKTQAVLQSILFFTSTFAIISCLIIYLWTYTEIDETMLSLDIYNSTANEFQNEIYELQSEIELLEKYTKIRNPNLHKMFEIPVFKLKK